MVAATGACSASVTSVLKPHSASPSPEPAPRITKKPPVKANDRRAQQTPNNNDGDGGYLESKEEPVKKAASEKKTATKKTTGQRRPAKVTEAVVKLVEAGETAIDSPASQSPSCSTGPATPAPEPAADPSPAAAAAAAAEPVPAVVAPGDCLSTVPADVIYGKLGKFQLPFFEALGIYPVVIDGDGNCLFRSLSDQVYGVDHHHAYVRQRVVDYQRSHPDEFVAFHVGDSSSTRDRPPRRRAAARKVNGTAPIPEASIDNQYASLQAHCDKMAKLQEWGGEPEIKSFTAAFGVDVNLYDKDKIQRYFSDGNGMDGKKRRVVHISYHNGNHYNSIREVGGTVAPALPNLSRLIPDDIAVVRQTADMVDGAATASSAPPAVVAQPWQIDSIAEAMPGVSTALIREMLVKCRGDLDNAFASLLESMGETADMANPGKAVEVENVKGKQSCHGSGSTLSPIKEEEDKDSREVARAPQYNPSRSSAADVSAPPILSKKRFAADFDHVEETGVASARPANSLRPLKRQRLAVDISTDAGSLRLELSPGSHETPSASVSKSATVEETAPVCYAAAALPESKSAREERSRSRSRARAQGATAKPVRRSTRRTPNPSQTPEPSVAA